MPAQAPADANRLGRNLPKLALIQRQLPVITKVRV